MNKVILVGRLTADPETRWSTDGNAVTTYTVAVDRRYKRDGEQSADFIRCVSFGKAAEFAEKYFTKGMRIAVSGHIQTGSYTNREGRVVYTTDVVVEEHEFAQSKGENVAQTPQRATEEPQYGKADKDGFMEIPDGIEEKLPFN